MCLGSWCICGKTYKYSSNSLLKHQETCKLFQTTEKYERLLVATDVRYQIALLEKDEENMRLTEENNRLRNEITSLSTRPIYVTNNTVNNVNVNNGTINTCFNIDTVKSYLHKLEDEHIEDGASGLARFAVDYPLRNSVICTDVSRQVLAYITPDGMLRKDYGHAVVSPKFFKGVQGKVSDRIPIILEKRKQLSTDPIYLLDEEIRLKTIDKNVRDAANGKDSKFVRTWTKDVSCRIKSDVDDVQ
jgi:hypothetical protein